ncbi:MAG: hypothetical protein ACLUKN_11260 [Bacilli bacterium]
MPKNGSEVMLTLWTYIARIQALYGLAAAADRDFFKILVEKVSGIGQRPRSI